MLNLNDAWEFLNDKAFNGEMVHPRILAHNIILGADLDGGSEKEVLFGAYQDGGGSRGEILLLKKLKDEYLLETLYHEMCHQFVYEVLLNDKVQHGQMFNEIYKEGLQRLQKCLLRKSKVAINGGIMGTYTLQGKVRRSKRKQLTLMATKKRKPKKREVGVNGR